MKQKSSIVGRYLCYGFRVTNNLELVGGTYSVGKILVQPKLLSRLLGRHRASCEGAVSRLWVVQKGFRVFTIYDWKQTSNYQPYLPDARDFWNLEKPVLLDIGTHDGGERDAEDLAKIIELYCCGACHRCGMRACICPYFANTLAFN